jgi:biopolymer transport protein TolQ
MVTASPLWHLVRQSDATTWAILLVLLVMSVICWTIALYKWTQLNKCIREMNISIKTVEGKTTKLDLDRSGHYARKLMGESLIVTSQKFFISSIIRYREQNDLRTELLMLRDDLDIVISEEVASAETHIAILKTCAEAAPLLGLLGTIWGLIHSFVRISSERVADIVTVAPGIAEALITTLMGLLVAIPALLFFHILHRKMQVYEQELVVLSERCEQLIRNVLVQEKNL